MTTTPHTTSLAWQETQSCQTLIQLHNALIQLRPSRGADPQRWREYYLRSATAYEQIAEIDRGHHHESLYWAGRERRKSDAIANGTPHRWETPKPSDRTM